jgi:hypothetical protein
MENYSAFPVIAPEHGPIMTGLSKREYFASEAMKGILSNEELRIKMIADQRLDGTNSDNYIAFHAVKYADELIKQLSAVGEKI